MSTAAIDPITMHAGEGEAYWAFGMLVTMKATSETTGGRVAVIEHLAPAGTGSPLHVHRREDEWFYVLDGTIAFWIGGQVVEASSGAFLYGPRDVPHTFVVRSERARFLLAVEPAGFERFLRAVSRPAPRLEIPPPEPPPDDIAPLVAAAAEHGVEIIGPPGLPS
jgi:quercetin dioxygenase-like cupin family protein